MRECFCFGSEAVNASGEAVRGLVKSRAASYAGYGHYTMASADSKFEDFYLQCIQLNNKNVNELIARELSGFTCTRSQTMNSKFSMPHEAAECGIEISPSLLVNSCI